MFLGHGVHTCHSAHTHTHTHKHTHPQAHSHSTAHTHMHTRARARARTRTARTHQCSALSVSNNEGRRWTHWRASHRCELASRTRRAAQRPDERLERASRAFPALVVVELLDERARRAAVADSCDRDACVYVEGVAALSHVAPPVVEALAFHSCDLRRRAAPICPVVPNILHAENTRGGIRGRRRRRRWYSCIATRAAHGRPPTGLTAHCPAAADRYRSRSRAPHRGTVTVLHTSRDGCLRECNRQHQTQGDGAPHRGPTTADCCPSCVAPRGVALPPPPCPPPPRPPPPCAPFPPAAHSLSFFSGLMLPSLLSFPPSLRLSLSGSLFLSPCHAPCNPPHFVKPASHRLLTGSSHRLLTINGAGSYYGQMPPGQAGLQRIRDRDTFNKKNETRVAPPNGDK